MKKLLPISFVIFCIATSAVFAQSGATNNFTSANSAVVNTVSKQCRTDEGLMSESDSFGKFCAGFGKYKLILTGSDYRVNYAVGDASRDFTVYFHPLEGGDAEKYDRADRYDNKLSGQIEWRLFDGKPFAVIVHIDFYKNTGSAKTFANPKNKIAEFVFVRGLKGFEDLQFDLATADTAFNPQEQARKLADEFYEKKIKMI